MALDNYHDEDGFYVKLDVAPTASHDEITRSYRRLAHSAHPDARPDDPDASRRFRELTEAYEVLGNPARRARYDTDQAWGGGVAARPPSSPDLAKASRARAGGLPVAPGPGPLVGSPGPGAPVFIGTGHGPTPSAWLSVGPVQVAAPSPGAATALGQHGFASPAGWLLSELLAPWEWY